MISRYKKVGLTVAVFLGTLLIATVFFFRFYQFYTAVGDSMSPTLQDGKTYLVERGPLFPNRGDIIIFYYEPNDLKYIKRVVALEGESIQIRDQKVLIDGEELDEFYLDKQQEIPDFGPEKVPKDHVFVLGDDRVESVDSRQFGPIDTSSIQGKIANQ